MFTNDIFGTIEPPHEAKFKLEGTTLPSSQDLYFAAKWHEIFDRYCMARNFLRKTSETNWDYWFTPVENEQNQKAFELIFMSQLYEAALIFYNIIVDLSWTITYVTAEYALYKFDSHGNIANARDIQGMLPIEESYKLLRETENGVSSPNTEGNPFDYLKIMQPSFKEAIDLIIEFWKYFSNSNIRNIYNFIKHKGKPQYREIEELRGGKIIKLQMGTDEYPTDIRDVQKFLNLSECIGELIIFDDEKLYHYIKNLLEILGKAVNPSPIALE